MKGFLVLFFFTEKLTGGKDLVTVSLETGHTDDVILTGDERSQEADNETEDRVMAGAPCGEEEEVIAAAAAPEYLVDTMQAEPLSKCGNQQDKERLGSDPTVKGCRKKSCSSAPVVEENEDDGDFLVLEDVDEELVCSEVGESAMNLVNVLHHDSNINSGAVYELHVHTRHVNELREEDVLRDADNRDIYIKRVMKSSVSRKRQTKTGDRVYNAFHACVYCGRFLVHIRKHLQAKHADEEGMKRILETNDQNEAGILYDRLRVAGDDKHNCSVIAAGAGELLLARRPTGSFRSADFGPCPNCRDWMKKSTLRKHQKTCRLGQEIVSSIKAAMMLQSDILAGRFTSRHSRLMQKEVLPMMKDDEISRVAKNDPLIVLLGETWLRRYLASGTKNKHFSLRRMRLAAKLLMCLRNDMKAQTPEAADAPLWYFLTPRHFDSIARAAISVSIPQTGNTGQLRSPLNAIKLKSDIVCLVSVKWATLSMQMSNDSTTSAEGNECRYLLRLMKSQWDSKVTRLVASESVLSQQKSGSSRSQIRVPRPEDMRKLVEYLKSELQGKALDYRRCAILVQARLLLYNRIDSEKLDDVT